MSDARAAGELAAGIARREISPYLRAWDASAPDTWDEVRRPFAGAGLLDEDLPPEAGVEVALSLGRVGLRPALAVLSIDPASSQPDLKLAAALAGAGDALVECGIAYAQQRVVFGRPLSRFPVQRNLFAQAAAQNDAAIALCRRAAEGADALDVAAALPVAVDAAWRAADTALQVHGGYGYTDEYDVSRMWREVVAVRASLPRTDLDSAVTSAAGSAVSG